MAMMNRRAFLTGVGGVSLLSATGTLGLASEASAATYAGYAMAYFTESPSMTAANYSLHLAVSSDGLNWTPLNQNNSVATPTLAVGVCAIRSSCASRPVGSSSWPPISTAPTGRTRASTCTSGTLPTCEPSPVTGC